MSYRAVLSYLAGFIIAGLILDLFLMLKFTWGPYPPIWGSEATELRNCVLVVYQIPLAIIFGGSLASWKQTNRVPVSMGCLFLGGCAIWVLLTLVPMLKLISDPNMLVTDCMSDLKSINEKAGFLLMGTLAYFFGMKKSSTD